MTISLIIKNIPNVYDIQVITQQIRKNGLDKNTMWERGISDTVNNVFFTDLFIVRR